MIYIYKQLSLIQFSMRTVTRRAINGWRNAVHNQICKGSLLLWVLFVAKSTEAKAIEGMTFWKMMIFYWQMRSFYWKMMVFYSTMIYLCIKTGAERWQRIENILGRLRHRAFASAWNTWLTLVDTIRTLRRLAAAIGKRGLMRSFLAWYDIWSANKEVFNMIRTVRQKMQKRLLASGEFCNTNGEFLVKMMNCLIQNTDACISTW